VSSTNPFDAPYTSSSAEPMDVMTVLFSFEGRVPRRVYWGYSLGVVLVYFVVAFVLALVLPEEVAQIVLVLSYIPLLWSSFAVQVKRWHDRGYSGWMVLIGFIPIVGPLWSFVELGCLRGEEGPNAYGADPT
jgi:uncharacterized membrane protein YhaH (DUF805 family)